MSHIFISYCHKDMDSLELLRQKLQASGLEKEIWYDKHLEAGNQWIPEIDAALNDAYCVVVIVTPDSTKSNYVTYEWSSAIGKGTFVIPLLFKGRRGKIHPRLEKDLQVEDCRTGIPEKVIDAIISHRSTPPEINFLNRQISHLLLGFRVSGLIALWYFRQMERTSNNEMRFSLITDIMLAEANKITWENLPNFITSRLQAFNKQQLRSCRALLEALERFWYLFHEPIGESVSGISAPILDLNAGPKAIIMWEQELAPLMAFFRTRNFYEEALDTLVAGLQALAKGETEFERIGFVDSFEIIDLVFEDENVRELLKATIQQIVDKVIKSKSKEA